MGTCSPECGRGSAGIDALGALERIRVNAQRHQQQLVNVADLDRPMQPEEFEEVIGLVRQRDGRRELLIPAARFQHNFPDYRSIMQELRGAGLARTEGGEQTKLTIKAPKAVCETGRVYCILIG